MKTLTIVIPVYNEEKRIEKTFKALEQGFCFDGIKLERIIFVDDGSTDNTNSKLSHFAKASQNKQNSEYDINIISYKQNRGKGYAVKAGMFASASDYTLFFDADISTPLSEFAKFLPFARKNIPIIIGTRKNGLSTVVIPQPLYRQLLGRCFTILSNLIFNIWVTDFTCGFKMIAKEAKNKIFMVSRINRWACDSEILYLAKTMGFSIVEVPIIWMDSRETKVRLFKDIFASLMELAQIKINGLTGVYQSPKIKRNAVLQLSHQPPI
jgi:dolichyl-phosphate beta-glucosyltransferase